MPNKRDGDMDDMSGKKSRSEPAEANLIPEDVFLSSNPNPVTFGVQIPNMPDKGEWKLDGNTIRLTLPPTDQVSVGEIATNILLFEQNSEDNKTTTFKFLSQMIGFKQQNRNVTGRWRAQQRHPFIVKLE